MIFKKARAGPVLADLSVEFLVGGRPVVSATPDSAAAANAAFQAAPAWLTRANTPPANDLFAGLVNQNTPNDSATALPPPPPSQSQNSADTSPPPPANNASNNNA